MGLLAGWAVRCRALSVAWIATAHVAVQVKFCSSTLLLRFSVRVVVWFRAAFGQWPEHSVSTVSTLLRRSGTRLGASALNVGFAA